MRKILVVICSLVLSISCFSQTGYSLQTGQSMSIDSKGTIVNSASDLNKMSKECETQEVPSIIEDINSIYYNDGTIKIPGFTPTGNAEADKELYKKAKLQLYNDNPEEYKKIFGHKGVAISPSIIPYEEFQKYPDNKKQIILSHPEKFRVDLPVDSHDCK